MAINTLRTNVAKNLNAIGFKKITGQHDLSPRDSFKKIIQRGDGLDFNVVDNFTFTVSIQDENYYRALTADFNYSLTRIKRQKDTFNKKESSFSMDDSHILLFGFLFCNRNIKTKWKA